ncbi:Sorting nexin-33 [Eumeta japonica]|uniref:Sorting nexin-33 n=1 Tax=Eumeta variegata TaxID=151549 RepID=A0A4C1SVA1_EUMVA|nr:Sorting nexin-33 [Eumeta japonica]
MILPKWVSDQQSPDHMFDPIGEPGSSEISVKVGDILCVTRTDVGEGWWEGKNVRGEVGLFPAAYVEVLSANEVKQQNSAVHQNSGARYDSTVDEYNNDGDDWEDDWDDENETYSEIGPSNNTPQMQSHALTQSTSCYDNKFLPATPCDDISSASITTSNTALKKTSMFGKSSDSFILGLGNKDKLPESEKVQIVPFENLYQWQQNFQPYSVTVDSPKKESKFKGMKTFIAYQLTPSFNNISVSL